MPKSLIMLLVILLVVQSTGMAAFADESVVSFRWENWDDSERAFLEGQRAVLKIQGADMEPVEEMPPSVRNPAVVWLILAGTAAVSVLAETIVNAVKTLNRCGMVVDALGEELKIRKNCELDGDILARHADGQLERIPAKENPSHAVDALFNLLMTKIGSK